MTLNGFIYIPPIEAEENSNERVSQSDEEKSFISEGGRGRDATSTPCEER
jgi:hypothetical protein